MARTTRRKTKKVVIDQTGAVDEEHWMNSKWRPMMGWMYMAICLFDFMIAPILWSLIQAYFHGGIATQWQPLTLQGAGLFHLAMGAVIGISAYGRTQEKLNGAEGGGLGSAPAPNYGSFGPNAGTTYVPPNQMNNGMGNNGMNGMGNNGMNGMGNNGMNSSGFGGGTGSSNGFGSSASGFNSSPPASTGFGGGFGSTTPPPASGFGSGFNSPAPAGTGFGSTPTTSTGFGSTPTTSTGFGSPAVNSTLPPAAITPAMAAANVNPADPSTVPLADPTVDPNKPLRRAK